MRREFIEQKYIFFLTTAFELKNKRSYKINDKSKLIISFLAYFFCIYFSHIIGILYKFIEILYH